MKQPPRNDPASVLFVCTGNICRSPLAEFLFKDFVAREGTAGSFRIGSAGTYALNGNTATREAQSAARQWGLDISSHRAREVSHRLMDESDYVLGMTRQHCLELLREFPGHENKIYLALLFPREFELERLEGIDVPDPIGLPVDYYAQVLDMLSPALPRIMNGILDKEDQ